MGVREIDRSGGVTKEMAMAMALRRLSLSVDKPICRVFNCGSIYHMVLSFSFLRLDAQKIQERRNSERLFGGYKLVY